MGNLDGVIKCSKNFAGEVNLRGESLVIVHGVVMGDDPAFGVAEFGEETGVAERGMAPADLGDVFGVGVLRFVDEEVDAFEKAEEGGVGTLGVEQL